MSASLIKKVFNSLLSDKSTTDGLSVNKEQTINKSSKGRDYAIVFDITGGTASDKTGFLPSLQNVILQHQTKGDFPFQFNLEKFPRRIGGLNEFFAKKQIDIEFDPNNRCIWFKKFDNYGKTSMRTECIAVNDLKFNDFEEYYQILMQALTSFLNGTLHKDFIFQHKQNLLENINNTEYPTLLKGE